MENKLFHSDTLSPMRIIMFTGRSPDLILSGDKSMTARLWKIKPPSVGSLFRAQRGRRKDTSFSICRVTSVEVWDGFDLPPQPDVFLPFWQQEQMRHAIGRREGYSDWYSFLTAYQALNQHHWDDKERTHYFIGFKVVEVLEEVENP